jgi:hypothetical protein
LLFAIECILKALVFVESTEDEQRTYNKIIQTHNFDKLLNMLGEQTRLECNKFIDPRLKAYYVRIRYFLESHIDFRTEQGVLGTEYYATIANFHWLDDVNEKTKALLEYASSRNPVAMEVIALSDVNIGSELPKHARFRGMRGPKK